ncbi:MAG: PepSY domain-containing protein [Candidatus Neomarinimicrobiota bacterium]
MKHIPILLQLLILMFFGATVALPETEEEIPLSEVPKEIIAAAQEAVPGIELTEAEVEKTRKGLVYELDGTVDGKEYEIVISADGEVLEIESEDDDEDVDDADEGEEEDEGDEEDKDNP